MNAYALGQVTDTMGTMEDRAAMGMQPEGKNLWVKAVGKYSKTDKLTSDGAMKGGYEATTTGIIFGADVVNTESLTLGAAFSYAKGDLKSQGNYTKTDTDAEIFGGDLYGAYRMGDAAIIGHLGYASAKGEVTQNYTDIRGNGYKIAGDVDSEYVTFGVRGEMKFQLDDSLTLVPHLGVRYIHGKTKAYDIAINGKTAWKVDSETSDVVQVPVGVAVKGEFKTKGWMVKPVLDLSLVHSAGDTDAKGTVHATGYQSSDSYRYDVAGKTAGELKLGISAEKKNHSFGLSYTGSVGTKGSQNHGITAHYNYRF